MKQPANTLRIEGYLHCALCLDEAGPKVSPRDYQRIQVGWTHEGIQVWCSRHECNIVHVDFEGVRHPANTTRLMPDPDGLGRALGSLVDAVTKGGANSSATGGLRAGLACGPTKSRAS